MQPGARDTLFSRGVLGDANMPQTRRYVLLAVFVLALCAVFSFSAAQSARAGYVSYYSNVATNGITHYTSGYNLFTANEDYNGGDVWLEIKERHTNGTINWVYSGQVEVGTCHGGDYTEDGCEDINGGDISMTCYSDVDPC